MCTFNKELENINSVTGYKCVIVDKYNHYYSPVTGMRYKIGKIGKIKGYGAHSEKSTLAFCDILNPNSHCYNPLYKGRTAIFKNYDDAKSYLKYLNWYNKSHRIKFAIIEMELSGNLYIGEYYDSVIFAGSEIKSIKKVKE
jgi:hypothetical protein